MTTFLHSLALTWLLAMSVGTLYFLVTKTDKFFWQLMGWTAVIFALIVVTAIAICYVSGVEIVS